MLIAPGVDDGLGEGDGEPEGGIGFGLGDTRGVGVAGSALIVYVLHAGDELTELSVPHTLYEPGAAPLGGAVGGVELAQLLLVLDGTELVAQFIVDPKDQDTWL